MITERRFSLVLVAAAFAANVVFADKDLVINGKFERDQVEVPMGWPGGYALGKTLFYTMSGGPGETPSARFSNDGERTSVEIRQSGLTLVPGEEYRLSAMVRTKGFSSDACGIIVIDAGWNRSIGLNGFPQDSEWKEYTRTFKMIESRNCELYGLVIYVPKFVGELEVANLRLEALSEKAIAGSKPIDVSFSVAKPRLVPWGMTLSRIPEKERKAVFKFYGAVQKGKAVADYDVVLTTDDSDGEVRQPLAKGENAVALPEGASSGRMRVRIEDRVAGTALTDDSFRFALVRAADVDTVGTRLNSFVVELVNEPSKDGEKTFGVGRREWVFISVGEAERPVVTLDGVEVISPALGCKETFREVGGGEHKLVLAGTEGSRLVVRRIPEILNYCVAANSLMTANPPYDRAFDEKYVFPGCTTLNGGRPDDDLIAWTRAHGYRWLANFGSREIKSGGRLIRNLKSANGILKPQYDGVTCDEQFFTRPKHLDMYTQAMKAFNADYQGGKDVYSWICGSSFNLGLDQEFFATTFAGNGGRGKAISEIYCRTRTTEQAAKDNIASYLKGTFCDFSRCYPGFESQIGIILGNFNQIPVLSLAHHPEVNFKYFLDLQLHMMANDPVFEKLGCTGYWGSYYADEELHRWSFALTRHYCVEGKKTMLSEEYGYKYVSGIVTNGDFIANLDGWKVEGAVSVDRVKGLGANSEGRWGGSGVNGDSFAVFAKRAGETARLTQEASGLVPGRRYCLQAATFDVKDAKAGKTAPRKLALEVSLKGAAERDETKSYVWVDDRAKGRYKNNNGVARINLHHIVFTAGDGDVSVEIANPNAAEGEELGVNCVSIHPYFE